jgi:endoglucanase
MTITSILAALIMTGSAHHQGVPANRYANLQRGLNVSHWWADFFKKDYSEAKQNEEVNLTDFKQLKAAGFTHIRLPIDPEAISDGGSNPQFKQDKVNQLLGDIKEVESAGLAVMVDCHPARPWKLSVPDDPDKLVNFWKGFAPYLKGLDPNKTFPEIMNEPTVPTDVWQPIQARAIQVVRAALPDSTIIVTGGLNSKIEGLVGLRPYSDSNLIYTFHSYDPKVFTHQGAGWRDDAGSVAKEVPYPSTPDNIRQALASIRSPEMQAQMAQKWSNARFRDRQNAKYEKEIMDYGNMRFDYNVMLSHMKVASDWAKANGGLKLLCGEFGALRKVAPRDSRLNYITDARKSMEQLGIGWTMWNYNGDFGMYDGKAGNRQVDTGVLHALGL